MTSKTSKISAFQIEDGDVQTAVFTVPIQISAFQIEEGDTQSALISAEQSVELESSIPPDAKQAVKDFINEQISQIMETAGEFVIRFPAEFEPYIKAIIEIISKSIG